MHFRDLNTIGNLRHDEVPTEVGVSSAISAHAERKSANTKPSVQAWIEERLLAQLRLHHDEGSILRPLRLKILNWKIGQI